MKLSLGLINSYGLQKRSYNPDWDDRGYEYTLPSGIVVSGLFMCNNEPCEMDMLEGVDGYVLIDTVEKLEEYINMSLDETFDKIKLENPIFNKEDYE